MRIVYLTSCLSLVLVGSAVAQERSSERGAESWQDIVRSTQQREPVGPAPEDTAPAKKMLYKVYDANGVPSFTDVAPKKGAVESVEMDSQSDLNVLGDKSSSREKYESQILREAAQKKWRKESRKAAVDSAQKALQSAKQAQADGVLPLDAEWQRTNKGRRFLKPDFQARQDALAKAVKAAEQRLKSVSQRRP